MKRRSPIDVRTAPPDERNCAVWILIRIGRRRFRPQERDDGIGEHGDGLTLSATPATTVHRLVPRPAMIETDQLHVDRNAWTTSVDDRGDARMIGFVGYFVE